MTPTEFLLVFAVVDRCCVVYAVKKFVANDAGGELGRDVTGAHQKCVAMLRCPDIYFISFIRLKIHYVERRVYSYQKQQAVKEGLSTSLPLFAICECFIW
jgi:hypothetical protein